MKTAGQPLKESLSCEAIHWERKKKKHAPVLIARTLCIAPVVFTEAKCGRRIFFCFVLFYHQQLPLKLESMTQRQVERRNRGNLKANRAARSMQPHTQRGSKAARKRKGAKKRDVSRRRRDDAEMLRSESALEKATRQEETAAADGDGSSA